MIEKLEKSPIRLIESDYLPKPGKPGRKRKDSNDPIGSVNVKRSTLERIHRIREAMSSEGKLIPLHEVMAKLVEAWENGSE